MKLYIIMNTKTEKPVRYGLMGDNATVGYCMNSGCILALESMGEAMAVISGFTNPQDFTAIEFTH